MRRWALALLSLLLVAASGCVHAVIACSITSAATHAYDPTLATTTVAIESFRVTCTKSSAADPASVNFSVTVNNGSNPQGVNNRASMGVNTFRYDVYRDAGCNSKWKGATAISGTVPTPSTGTYYVDVTYYMCIAAGIAAAAGTYTDTVTMTLNYGPGAGVTTTGAMSVSIATPAICSITSGPVDLVFNYIGFGAAQAPTSSFGVTCTLHLPYTMALDTNAGTALGLSYTLSLSSPSSVGTGALQTHSVNGAMAGGQAGTCGAPTCSSTATRTLTLSY